MRPLTVLCSAITLSAGSLLADTEGQPKPYVSVSPKGSVYFKMLPPGPNAKGGSGIAYRLNSDGSDEELWLTRGWYSQEVFLSVDGDYLVAMGPWADGHEPSKYDLAISFYHREKLIRQYSTADLVKDGSQVDMTASHYFWLARDMQKRGEPIDPEAELTVSWKNTFRLKTCDGILYEFDMTTGDILTPEDKSE